MNSKLVFRNGSYSDMCSRLCASECETAALLLACPIKLGNNQWRLLVDEIFYPSETDYTSRTSYNVELSPVFLSKIIKRARTLGSTIVLTHTHPGASTVTPSDVDLKGEARLLPTLFQRVPNVPHARLIVGADSYHAAILLPESDEQPLSVVDVGRDILFPSKNVAELSYEKAFDRQVRAFGEAGQQQLKAIRVAIIGLGGLGSVVAQQLAHLGVKDYLLIDSDSIETTNLNRLVGATSKDVGHSKVEVASQMICSIQPSARVEILQDTIVKASVARTVLNVDTFFCCTDSHGSRAILTQLSYQYLLPGFDMGVRIEVQNGVTTHITGRVQMLAPTLACLSCGEILDAEQVRRELLSDSQRNVDQYIIGDLVPQPAVISINSAVASLAVTMFLSAISGIRIQPRHQILRLELGVVKAVENKPNPICPICSDEGALAQGDRWQMPGRLA